LGIGEVLITFDTIQNCLRRRKTTSVEDWTSFTKLVFINSVVSEDRLEISKAREAGLYNYVLPKATTLFYEDG
jgi:hypothetical protein